MNFSKYNFKTMVLAMAIVFVSPMFGQGEIPETNPEEETEIINAIQKHAVYPEDALYEETEGTVYIAFKTDENQEISKIYVLRKDSDDEFEEAAYNAVKAFANCDDHKKLLASNHAYKVPINFNLEY